MKLIEFRALKAAKGVPYSRAHLARLIKAGKFPQPVKISANRVAFLDEEVDNWIATKADERASRLEA